MHLCTYEYLLDVDLSNMGCSLAVWTLSWVFAFVTECECLSLRRRVSPFDQCFCYLRVHLTLVGFGARHETLRAAASFRTHFQTGWCWILLFNVGIDTWRGWRVSFVAKIVLGQCSFGTMCFFEGIHCCMENFLQFYGVSCVWENILPYLGCSLSKSDFSWYAVRLPLFIIVVI